MEGGVYWDGNAAYRGITASEEARYMSASSKQRLAEIIRGSGIWVDDDVVNDVTKRDHEIEGLQRANAGDLNG
jgi:hypothetical protein